ncbi:MAG: hypothetical protein B7Y40_00705 [Gammaproteobacteria bacterium 28-57-27]|nr:MAG: hypothetical protein B7Y40_00705 [Gammaproteobacteria bacterium 28-57-27]
MIADSVTQPNVLVLAESPQISMGSLYQTISQGIALAMENALQQQGDLNIVYQASTNVGVQTLYGVDVSSTGVSHTAERFWD